MTNNTQFRNTSFPTLTCFKKCHGRRKSREKRLFPTTVMMFPCMNTPKDVKRTLKKSLLEEMKRRKGREKEVIWEEGKLQR